MPAALSVDGGWFDVNAGSIQGAYSISAPDALDTPLSTCSTHMQRGSKDPLTRGNTLGNCAFKAYSCVKSGVVISSSDLVFL